MEHIGILTNPELSKVKIINCYCAISCKRIIHALNKNSQTKKKEFL